MEKKKIDLRKYRNESVFDNKIFLKQIKEIKKELQIPEGYTLVKETPFLRNK